MNISQSNLENAVKNKMTSGYLAMDSKNTILWGSLTALFISSNVITYTTAYTGGWESANLAHMTTLSAIGYNHLESQIIDEYEKNKVSVTSPKSRRGRIDARTRYSLLNERHNTVNMPPSYSYFDENGNSVITPPTFN